MLRFLTRTKRRPFLLSMWFTIYREQGNRRADRTPDGHEKGHYSSNLLPTLLGGRLTGVRIQEQAVGKIPEPMFSTPSVIELEHVEQRAGVSVKREISDAAKTPVVFNKMDNRRLVSDRMIDVVFLRERRNNDEWHPRTERKTALITFRCWTQGDDYFRIARRSRHC